MNTALIKLPGLPYAKDALEPYVSKNTLNYHYDKHHNTYVVNLNKLIADTKYMGCSLEKIILAVHDADDKKGIFNNAAQVWNHTFYWHSMKQNGGGSPSGDLKERIEEDFGSCENFRDQFLKAGVGQFGSGWAWLVWDYNKGKLVITNTSNADLPMLYNQKALIVVDVWEHAYYLDYQNQRIKYLDIFLDKLLNWDFANKNFNTK